MIEEGERNSGGNRWPRQETIALLKIRSDMDVVFRDSSLKGPLWEQVSRKMADLGYHRNAKKCKEKFENVYKYHKRTKDGRASKADGKTYRFFEQLEAFENTSYLLPLSNTHPPPPPLEATPINMAMPMPTSNVQVPASQGTTSHHVTVSSAAAPPLNNPFVPCHQNTTVQNVPLSTPSLQPAVHPINNIPHQVNVNLPSHPNISSMSYSTSSSTSSDEDIQTRHKKKRKWRDCFDKFTKDVFNKQEESQRKFLEVFEQRERDRMIREEAWKAQEMERINREHDLLVQERAMAAAKDAAVISFLQKITEQKNIPIPIPNSIHIAPPSTQVQIENIPPAPAPTHSPKQTQPSVVVSPPQPSPAPIPISLPTPAPAVILTSPVPPKNVELAPKNDNGAGESYSPASSSRWPKAEVEALIKLRTNLDVKYQENGPKGPLWEEISAGMRKIGYNRNPKRCKEKWENINKYFKKVKESNKKRPEDSKTCPYFHQLDALYKEKAKNETSSFINPSASEFALNPESNPMAPIMARPEQQWPLPPPQQQHQTTRMDHDNESDNMDDDDHDDEEEDEDEENAYEIVANKQQSSIARANMTTTTTATTTV
ncbi:unnamed protein product [Withania somnifera]